ncbi:MAG: tetratricopeptide repeat protein [Deltaproteobacteria bacterium]|nr:tetratricopeptide repeat protein [Deltaproteobacteria bacterium]
MTDKDVPPLDMDAVSAHLDRSWDLFKKHDMAGAELSVRKALELEPDLPEAHALLGMLRAAEGENDEALEHFRRALELDPGYVTPKLHAAELLLAGDGDPEEALEMIGDAIETAEDEEEYLDALLLKVEALTGLGRLEEAEETIGELPPVQFPEAIFHVRAGHSFLDLGFIDDAEEQFRKALEMDPDLAEAHHSLGLVYEERGDVKKEVECWLKVRELDLKEPKVPWSRPVDEFETIAEQALAELPERIRKLLENVPITVEDYPSIDLISEGNDPRALGFFSGIPYPEKSHVSGATPHLDCVYLFQRNIERISHCQDEVAEEIRITLIHETGHFFGLSDEDLEQMGLG